MADDADDSEHGVTDRQVSSCCCVTNGTFSFLNHVQRAAHDSRRDEVGDPHSTAEWKCVDVGDVGQRRLQEQECTPVTGIGSR